MPEAEVKAQSGHRRAFHLPNLAHREKNVTPFTIGKRPGRRGNQVPGCSAEGNGN